MKGGNARGAKGAGHRRWIGSTDNGRSPIIRGRRQPSCDGTSRMNREVHVRICERLGVKFPGPTRQQPSFRPAILYGSEPIRKATPVVFHQLWTPRRAGRAPWRLGGERERPNPQG